MNRKRVMTAGVKQGGAVAKSRSRGRGMSGTQAAPARGSTWFDVAEIERLLAGLALNG
jgi:hypothetical protein